MMKHLCQHMPMNIERFIKRNQYLRAEGIEGAVM